ncbi:nuclear protein 96-domain-containing protein [Crucibulum laeve]|uniref:Nuclear protein 96-domain-containing protein n=1 Tax=Crucibulum laeve TaxID=68775 RepID=A0A5C3LHK4_9AGAR|nr:nuclear protein 96-domain-containing protein [Crucibulum laeve]
MARFRAYTTDSSSSEEEPAVETKTQPPKLSTHIRPHNGVHSGDEEHSDSGSSSSSSSSEMLEEDLVTSRRRARPSKTRGRNALVEDENGEIQYAHTVGVRVSPPSSLGSSPPPTGRATTSTTIPWAQAIGVDAQKMHVMQTSLFRMPEEAAALKALNHPQKPPLPRVNLRAPPQLLNRKHSRDSDGDGQRFEPRERASFAHDIEPPVYRPSRKYARVETSSSIANDYEGAFVDAGLAMGRSFRVSWGPRGSLVHLGSICGPFSNLTSSANSSIVTITPHIAPHSAVALAATTAPSSQLPASSPPIIASKLLQHQLSHTPITRDEVGIPFAYPSSVAFSSSENGSALPDTQSATLNFASFNALFPSTETTGPAALFRLGSALFDPMDLHLKVSKRGMPSAITPDIRNRVSLLRRKTSLSKWLEESVKSSVEGDVRVKANGNAPSVPYTAADKIFTQLTGHRIEGACETARDEGYPRLSILIAQAGGDANFKAEILEQLAIWKEDKLGPNSAGAPQGLINRGVWRVYSLLAGLLGGEDDDTTDVGQNVCAGLDWKRVFGLCLWYAESVDASVADVVRAYENLLLRRSNIVAKPIPTWLVNAQKKAGSTAPHSLFAPSRLGLRFGSSLDKEPEDALYALIKLHADPALSLSRVLDPLSFGPSGLDWGISMCWHLYIILSRVMRVRDFADRGEPAPDARKLRLHNGVATGINGHAHSSDGDETDGDDVEGHSPTADLLASSYAFQLESWGMIQEAVFVLLHLEGSVGREKAIKDLLARSAPTLDTWMTRGLVGSLKIPMAWVDEAKAVYALNQGDVFAAYEYYLDAGLYNPAHEIAVLELAPDAIIRKDLELLKIIFERFTGERRKEKIDGWFLRGKAFLDYVEIMIELPKLQEQLDTENEEGLSAIPDASQLQAIDDLTRRVPNLIGILPDVLYRSRMNDARHVAALEEMVKGLLSILKRSKPIVLTQIHQPVLSMVDAATKLELVRGTGYARFLQSIGA